MIIVICKREKEREGKFVGGRKRIGREREREEVGKLNP